MSVVEVDGLRKTFGDVTALEGISLSIEAGEIYGFLGPNGAGKSTAINVVLDFVKPTAGDVRVFGQDPSEAGIAVRKRTGTLLEGYGAYPVLTGREHLEHARDVKDTADPIEPLLERVGLAADADRPAGEYSKGMRQRMAIAMAVIGDPDLLILDEPTTGLDPNGALMLRELVTERARNGTTVFFSSHILEHVDAVADRVGILVDGSIVAEGDLEQLRSRVGFEDRLVVDLTEPSRDLPPAIEAIAGVESVTTEGSRLEVVCRDPDAKLRTLTTVDDYGLFEDFHVETRSLDRVFSALTEGDS